MDAEPGASRGTTKEPCVEKGSRCEDAGLVKNATQDSLNRRLRRENHLLRLQLLKLREQHRDLLYQVAAAGLRCQSDDTRSFCEEGAVLQQNLTASTDPSRSDRPHLASSCDSMNGEAAVLRARMLQRQEARQQRTTSARTLLHVGEEMHGDKADAALHSKCDVEGAAAEETGRSGALVDEVALMHTATPPNTGDCAPRAAGVQLALASDVAREGRLPAEDDMSAQAMLQRFQNRRARRRLRLEQMLGNADGVDVETTPFGNAPRHLLDVHEEGSTARLNSSNSNSSAAGGSVGAGSESVLDATASASGVAVPAVGHRSARVSEAVWGAGSAPVGPTQNPNQIGRVVSDAIRNNSWYLCKVLEAALLDTIQARHVSEASASAQTTSFHPPTPPPPLMQDSNRESRTGDGAASTNAAVAARLCAPTTSPPNGRTDGERGSSGTPTPQMARTPQSAGVSPTSAASPQFLYQVGVSETALRRAIEESLVLPFRCIQNTPQRLTSQQAADEAVPPFETENKDGELRRCFAGHGMHDWADRGARTDAVSALESNTEDEVSSTGLSALGAEDDNLDPFARLLLARLSAEMPSGNGKGDKKHKDHRATTKQRDEFLQGLYLGAAEGGQPFGASIGKATSPASPSASKPNAAFVMAAAGGDGKVHIPKKHFSRLDEVQVEMHAPVIFNQIRGFLRLDVDRFRRSFSHNGSRGEAVDGLRDATVTDGQQRRVRASGMAGGTDNATSWRISVSPGKSGTTLLYFGDYVMKTVRPSEMEFFTRKFLPAYVRYCERNPHTLLPRFYALVTVRWWKAGIAQHFVLMHNVFATPYYIHRIYDVKGSTVNRTALQPGKPPPRTAFGALLLKDNDLPGQLIICGAYQRAILLAQFRSDVSFLRQLNIVDYSCMIGVRSRLFSREEGPSKTIVLQRHQHHGNEEPNVDPLGMDELPMPLAGHQRTHSEITNVTSEAAVAGEQTVSVAIAGTNPAASLPLDSRPASEDDVYVCIHGCDGGLLSLPIYAPGDDTTAREDVYYLGIIDVLQTYNSAKKLESFAKGFVNDRQAISVIPPDGYSERLYKVLERITI